MSRIGNRTGWIAGILLSVLGAAPLLAEEEKSAEERLKALEEWKESRDRDGGSSSSGGNLKVSWEKGLLFESADRSIQVRLGGRLHNDWAWISEDDDINAAFGGQEDGTEFRFARLNLKGTLYNDYLFKIEYDFEGGDADFKDVYLGARNLPHDTIVRIGHFYEPISLEQQTSENSISFMERSLPVSICPSRNTGLCFNGVLAEKRITWAAGVFHDTDGYGDGGMDGSCNVTGRLTGLPWYEEDGAELVHLGIGGSFRKPRNDTVSFDSPPEVHLASDLVDTGNISADEVTLFGVEGALVYGPFSLQAEYIMADVDVPAGSDPVFDGYYVFGSWFLTGEHRNYKTSSARFGGITPKEDFSISDPGGPGAWEATLRYSTIDLTDGAVTGGEEENITVGLNWHLNPNMRIMANLVHARLDDVGDLIAFMLRFQCNF